MSTFVCTWYQPAPKISICRCVCTRGYIPPKREQKAQRRLRERHTHSATVIAQRGACNNYGQRYRGCSCCLMDIESLMIRRPFGSIDPNSIRETELHTECRRRRERESLYSPQHDINRKTALCHHRPQTKSHSNEYVNITPKAEQALPAWRGVGRNSRDTNRCCPAATVRAAVVFSCGFRCCFAD